MVVKVFVYLNFRIKLLSNGLLRSVTCVLILLSQAKKIISGLLLLKVPN